MAPTSPKLTGEVPDTENMTVGTTKTRTDSQNRSLHRFFELLADELNSAGLDQRKVLKPGIEIPWSKESIKQQLWKPVQEMQFGKRSTTELTSKEIDQVFDTLNRHLGEKFGVNAPQFPSIENMIDES